MPAAVEKHRNVTIIVPVYGDWPSLDECIRSLKKYIGQRQEVLFVNDCGPEVEAMERNIKQAIKGHSNFKYHRNSGNLGFVKTCNRAVLELDRSGNDVLLLNSDTKTTKGFLEEMRAVLYSSEDISAVCPRSNSATIFSVPVDAHTKDVSMEDSYRMFKKIKDHLPRMYRSPIAHGFCMLIRRSVIDEVGLFDEIYDKGYGEENDFCMRARKNGYVCAVANRAYVFHYKAKSFTPEKRNALVAKNEKILDKRYPGYRKLVEDYARNLDPVEWSQSQTKPPTSKLLSAAKRLFR